MALSIGTGIALLSGAIAAADAPTAEPVPEPMPLPPVDAPPSPETETEAPPAEDFVPPAPLDTPEIAFPKDAPPITQPVVVEIVIRVAPDGTVDRVELRRGAGEPFDSAVLTGATHFRFVPARYQGEPVAVEINYAQQFVPRQDVEATPEQLTAAGAKLSGLVVERGTGMPLPRASVVLSTDGEEHVAITGTDGKFTLEIPPGRYDVRIVAEGYQEFKQLETVGAGTTLHIKYLVTRESYNPYEATVYGQRERTEISRTTLRGREITRIPGTFGDPFRIVSSLPGVTEVIGGLIPLPVVRGSSPGNTGFLLDGARVPMLFHLFAGPAVIHPEFIDRVDFFPGGFGVPYGGYIGGIVDGKTRRARKGESRYEANITLTQSGAFVRRELPGMGMTATLAGRFGYPGWLISLANPDVSLAYWDYQARTDGTIGNDTVTAFLYGAQDEISTRPTDEFGNSNRSRPLERSILFGFHRLDVRYRDRNESNEGTYRLMLTTEAFQLDRIKGSSLQTAPEIRWRFGLNEQLTLRLGAGGAFDNISALIENDRPDVDIDELILVDGVWINSADAFVDLTWKIGDFKLIPGARADVYWAEGERAWSVDPRFLARYLLRDEGNQRIWLKGGAGWYHQPPRLFIAIPVIRTTDLRQGFLAAVHTTLGAEVEVGRDVSVDLQGYFNYMDPVFQEMTTNPSVAELLLNADQDPGLEPSPEEDGGPISPTRTIGRAYGIEILLRKRTSGLFFGWLAYTFSRSDRRHRGEWIPFDYDRMHIFNAVGGIRLPRNWELGARLSLQSGTPVTTIHGFNSARAGSQMRLDVRMDKRAVWNEWMLDFYIDIINVAVTREGVGFLGGDGFRFVLPTIGFRAVL
ncbi:MAG: carboxypeptidase regulatory-like domain-containing protein [Myxococcota bacterium]